MGQVDNLRSAVINTNSNGDNVVIAGVAGRTIKVKALNFSTSTSTTLTVYSGPQASGTALSGAMAIPAAYYEGDNGNDVYTCVQGEGFNLYKADTASLQGYVKYQLL